MTAINQKQSRIVFFGSPLIDLTIPATDSFLRAHNLENDTAYPSNDENKRIFDIQPAQISVGGSVTNTLRIFRKFAPHHQLFFVGSIGRDSNAELICRQLRNEHISTKFLYETAEFPTGKVAVLVCGKQRTLITDLGASKHFPQCYFNGTLMAECIPQATHIYLSAFFIGVSFDIVQKIMLLNPKPVIVLNLGATFLCTKYKQEISFMVRHADVIIGNENEHSAFANLNGVVSMETEQIFRCYANKQVIIMTRNEKGVMFCRDGKIGACAVPTALTTVKNTNGAGDVFAGGFLAKFLDGEPVEMCVQFGIAVVSNWLMENNRNF